MPPAPVYKGARGEAAGLGGGRATGGVLLPPGVGFPPFLVELGTLPSSRSRREGKGREKEKEGRPPLLSPIRTSPWGGVRPPFEAFLSFPVWPIKTQYEFPYSPVPRKIPESLGTFPKSEYSRPIYRSLRLDHFETPRHVSDPIRDSELLQYIKTHKLII